MTDRPTRAWCISYRAAWVLPIAAAPIRGGAVVVQGDRVAWVGRAGEEPASLGARAVELGEVVLGPGLVNSHTHLDLTALRGLLDGLAFFDWIRAVVAARAEMSADDLVDSARAGVMEGFRAGVTTFADTAPGDASFVAMRELGARGIAFLEAFGPQPSDGPAALADLRARVAAVRARASHLVAVGVSPHAPYSASDALYAALAGFARDEGLPLATHVAEGAAESELVERGAGPFAEFLRGRGIAVAPRARSPVALLERVGVLGPDALLIHCVRCDQEDVAAIARARAAVATCPMSNRYFGHGAAPVGALRGAGIRVGVGTDSMASNAGVDLLAEARAALGGAATLADTWAMASLDGARALGIDSHVGSIEAGKGADLTAFPILRSGGAGPEVGPKATLTVVAGVEHVRSGALVGAAGEAVTARVAALAARLRDRSREWRTPAPRR